MKWFLVPLFLCTACALEHPLPPTPGAVPEPPPLAQRAPLPDPLHIAPLLPLEPLFVALPVTPTPLPRPPTKVLKPVAPERLIREAEKEALVYPTARGYHGGIADHHYLWQPGKLFVVFLAPNATTHIWLPPGERLISGLALPDDAFLVINTRVGNEPMTQDVISLHPHVESKMVLNLSLLTESGRSYNLHIVVGKTAMVAVRFQMAPIMQLPVEEEPPLPRPAR
jgi:type IV secretory pathway VirB9-like protein